MCTIWVLRSWEQTQSHQYRILERMESIDAATWSLLMERKFAGFQFSLQESGKWLLL